MASKPHVIILGGGISGISAAAVLLGLDYPVTLVEARGFLGGRAFSFTDRQTGEQVDNGQHVIAGCCTEFRSFLKRLGLEDHWYIQPKLRITVLDRQGKLGLLKAGLLPSPFHLLGSFLTFPHLTFGDKIRVILALFRAKFVNRQDPHYERITFYDWLKGQGQSEQAVQNVWNLLVKPTLNDDVRDVSAAMGLMIVQEGMLGGYHSSDIGYAGDDLQAAIGDPAREYLTQQGCKLMLGSPVTKLPVSGDEIRGLDLGSGERVNGDVYLSALPSDALLKVLPENVVNDHSLFGNLRGLATSPIVNVHLWYDRPVLDGHFCALVDSPLQWVFNQTGILAEGSGAEADISGQHVCISISAAWDYIDQPRESLAKIFIAEMAEVFPLAREAKVMRSVVVKQRHATFRCLPGAGDLRPGCRTPLNNLFLAGEWTDTGWPSTMEGAVRSGYTAAGAIIDRKAV